MHFSLNTISSIALLLLAFPSLFTILSFRKARNLNTLSVVIVGGPVPTRPADVSGDYPTKVNAGTPADVNPRL